jgi:hypothetical protein
MVCMLIIDKLWIRKDRHKYMSMMNLGEICCTFATYVYVPMMNLLEE